MAQMPKGKTLRAAHRRSIYLKNALKGAPMRDAAPQTIHLKDYTPFGWSVTGVQLTFRLHPTKTRVVSRVDFVPTPGSSGEFTLHGEELTLIKASINGTPVDTNVQDNTLTCDVPDGPFTWQAEVEINPQTNTALSGLYMSNGMYCTQCEAEGFRRITFYPDRPDVLAPFKVRVEGDAPVLLSNGNPTSSGDGWAEWEDPWPKPAYLFALVAGELHAHPGRFKTMSGRDVDLNIYVRDGDQDKCEFAMEALIKSMEWDEQVYGREYDLDVFNIVAVDDFNMGAMENKGLNIFNSAAVLASAKTATDANFERIEAIIAHEYFHNWTGNRITCRDWFQLCLKEGLTVFRDQQFSADVRSAPVRRIEDVQALRGRQFREDNGPLAHPVRPASFVEINNFYTATVYEKGAELIRMLKILVGDDAYTKALDLYFDRHDGQACTIEDWLQVFEDTTGRDLSQFKGWYAQAGTPRVKVTEGFADGTYTLTLDQFTPAPPGQPEKAPLVIPFAFGLLNDQGEEVRPTQVIELVDAQHTVTVTGLAGKPVLSPLRGFSAPVILERDVPTAERLHLLRHDTDPFNRWESGRLLDRETMVAMIVDYKDPDPAVLQAKVAMAADESLDPAFRALCLALPGQDDVAQTLADAGATPDPVQIYLVREALSYALAQAGGDLWADLYTKHQVAGDYTPSAEDCGKRALTGAALGLITYLDGGTTAQAQFDTATNMTAQISALARLVSAGEGDGALAAFYEQWSHERLVIDKWFGLQVSQCPPNQAANIATGLLDHPDFSLTNPNRARALLGSFAMTPAAFHQMDGSGYTLMADQLIAIDELNPQLAARMSTMFETWKRYDTDRQAQMRAAMERIQARPGLSRDLGEMLERMMG